MLLSLTPWRLLRPQGWILANAPMHVDVISGELTDPSCGSVLVWLINELRANMITFFGDNMFLITYSFPSFCLLFLLCFFLKQGSQRCWPWQHWVQLLGSHSQRFLTWQQWTFLFQFALFLCLLPWWNMAPYITLPAAEKGTKEKKRRQNLSHQ